MVDKRRMRTYVLLKRSNGITGGSSCSANRRPPPPPYIFFLFFLSRNKKKTFTQSNRLRELFLTMTAVPSLIFWIRPWMESNISLFFSSSISVFLFFKLYIIVIGYTLDSKQILRSIYMSLIKVIFAEIICFPYISDSRETL